MTRRLRQIITPLVAILGVQAWLLITHGDWGRNSHVLWLGGAVVAGIIPPINRAMWSVLRRLRKPRAGARVVIALAVTAGAAWALAGFAISSHRDLFPTMHDEFQFLLQARMLAGGKLWMPGHPLADFFDTFYVLIQPKYAAQSFPGTAFFYVPAIWLHIEPCKWAIGIAAGTVGLMYLVATELADGLVGLAAAVMLARLSMLRYLATMALAQVPATGLGIASVGMWLRWRRKKTFGRALGLGLVAGLALLTRPADAVIYLLPIFVVMVMEWRGAFAATIAGGLVGLAPWLAVQIVFNVGVTGHWSTTPFGLYNQRDQPGLAYGINPVQPTSRPMTRVPEKRAYYHDVVRPSIAMQRPENLWHAFESVRLPYTIADDLPQPLLLAAAVVGGLAWGWRRAWVVGVGMILFFVVYTPYPIFTSHYAIVAAPAFIFTAALAPVAVAMAWPRARRAAWTVAAIFLTGLWMTRTVVDVYPLLSSLAHPSVVLDWANRRSAELEQSGRPVVVLFRRDPKLSAEAEPVYNLEAAWPDDEIVIRAHDRGRQNGAIFEYYSTHGANRAFYRFDEARPSEPLRYLGMASDLAKRSGGH